MEKNPSHSPDRHSSNPSQMDALPPLAADDSSVLWDWGDLLDFNDDLPLPISLDDCPRPPLQENSPSPPPPPVEEPPGSSGVDRRVRKRDPRLTCANFLAGRVPCACPEVDAKLLEEEEGTPGKKRTRTARASRDAAAAATKTKATGVGIVRCQVPECQADIRELKGYHRRHRVCLRCANASAVVLDGESKRYCQQCGKFHVLSDFDEGKRSCRRKLERHNNRRRRKTSDSKSPVEKESQVDTPDEDGSCENEAGQDSQVGDGEALLGPEATDLQTLCSDPVSQNIQNESVLSFMASGVEQLDEAKHNSRYTHSSACGDNKSTYSSLCATGRISFKLYDWNPAEFPRRLRHQIFQWLASMPVELEGYIRPGCTILTAFIAMPTFVWHKLLEDPASYLQNLVVAPQGMLSGRGRFHVHLNDEIFYFGKDLYGTSIREVEAKAHTPQLHYVEPICFEAGHPMEFVACGSYLNQTKFRFLISFAGKYLEPDYCVAAQHCEVGRGTDFSCEHEVYRIFIANTEPGVFGPAFIEVENESGLSNFLPILIGNGEVCSEVKRLLQNYDSSLCLTKMQVLATVSWPCEVSVTRVAAISEFLLDIAWLLRQPTLENVQCLLNFSWIQRFNCILSFLLKNECILILKNVLRYMEVLMDWDSFSNDTSNDDMSLLQSYMVQAKEIIQKRFPKDRVSVPDSGRYAPKRGYSSESCSADVSLHRHPTMKQDVELRKDAKLGVVCGATILKSTEVVPLLDKQVVMNVNSEEEWPKKSYSGIFSMKLMGTRPLVFVAATAAVCFGMCTVIYHPHKVGEFVVTIRRCLFDGV